ncbi:hypothetical protein C8T65DRAFT_751305 [Cerioporus squamosus]|nr:hypothetical protein C8T65DRAFT_751305 [Cerioporus squamosus]
MSVSASDPVPKIIPICSAAAVQYMQGVPDGGPFDNVLPEAWQEVFLVVAKVAPDVWRTSLDQSKLSVIIDGDTDLDSRRNTDVALKTPGSSCWHRFRFRHTPEYWVFVHAISRAASSSIRRSRLVAHQRRILLLYHTPAFFGIEVPPVTVREAHEVISAGPYSTVASLRRVANSLKKMQRLLKLKREMAQLPL